MCCNYTEWLCEQKGIILRKVKCSSTCRYAFILKKHWQSISPAQSCTVVFFSVANLEAEVPLFDEVGF